MIRLTHYFSCYHGLGGVQSILRRHEDLDRENGLDSKFIIGWERQREPQGEPRKFFLGISAESTIRLLRHRFGIATAQTRPDLMVYHTAESIEYLADLDGASRRIIVLHTHPPDLAGSLRLTLPLVDGVLCTSRPLYKAFLQEHPDWDPARVCLLPLPVDRPPHPAVPGRSSAFLIGYAGRLLKLMKRADRLVEFSRLLETIHPDCRLEIAGCGSLDAVLRRKLAGNSRASFLGRLNGEQYWNALHRWHAILCTSDNESGPMTLLEGMLAGTIPVCPDIPCEAMEVIREISPALIYPAGDVAAAADVSRRISRMSPSSIQELRNRLVEGLAAYRPAEFAATFSGFCHQILNMPGIARSQVPPRLRGLDDLSFSAQFKWCRWQTMASGILRRLGFQNVGSKQQPC